MTVSGMEAKHTALLNIDMQNFFVEGAPDGYKVLQRLNRLIASCLKADILVIHTTHVFKPQVPNVEEAVALHKDLNVSPKDIIFEKYHFGAFYNSNLEEIMHRRGIDTIIIGGIRTNVCCQTTAWEAISRGFRVFFLSDGTATKEMGGVSPAQLQAATCATLHHLFENVITVNDMIARIEEASEVIRFDD